MGLPSSNIGLVLTDLNKRKDVVPGMGLQPGFPARSIQSRMVTRSRCRVML